MRGFGMSLGALSIVLSAIVTAVSLGFPQAFAQTEPQTSEFTVIAGDEIKKNPTAMKILERIEQSKKILAEMQNEQKKKSEREKFIEEQRKIAKEILEKELASLNKKYEDYTPRNAFAKFVAGVNATHSAFFWDQFDYMNEKIKLANQAKQAVLQSGGTYLEARAEYIKYASMTRTEMIKLVSDLNIKYQFTDAEMQAYFDANGKLPRYEDDDVNKVCYGCAKYEKIKEEMLAKEELLEKQQNS
ncbi:MAG TPA: hypothetical protein VNK44_04390 [Candidatus Nitrosotenuis sp.]|nr:hypothetical protein [Candidatus Nitrosotenuis sp.]